MSVVATIQLYDDDKPDGEPFDKKFKDEQEMRGWIRQQNQHPWLSYRIKKVVDIKS
jgi:hypothetical protein